MVSEARKLYESPESLAEERNFVTRICELKDVDFFKLKRAFSVDYLVKKKSSPYIIATAEIKIRNVAKHQYPTLFLSKTKFDSGIRWMQGVSCYRYWRDTGGKNGGKLRRIEFLVFCRWLDGDYYYKYKEGDELLLDYGGMRNPRDIEDARDLLIHIPTELFIELK